jgi:hypothetical protein
VHRTHREDRNSIEMTAITALAHLPAATWPLFLWKNQWKNHGKTGKHHEKWWKVVENLT